MRQPRPQGAFLQGQLGKSALGDCPGDEVVRARIGVLCLPYICIQLQSFTNFENYTIGLSVKEAKLTGL